MEIDWDIRGSGLDKIGILFKFQLTMKGGYWYVSSLLVNDDEAKC